MRNTDPATWPLHPIGTLVAIEPCVKIEYHDGLAFEARTTRLVAVGRDCKFVGAGNVGSLVAVPAFFDDEFKTLLLPGGGGVILIDESKILAILPS